MRSFLRLALLGLAFVAGPTLAQTTGMGPIGSYVTASAVTTALFSNDLAVNEIVIVDPADATRLKSSGYALKTSMAAKSVQCNNTNADAPPTDCTVLLLGGGNTSAAAYSFYSDPKLGMITEAADSVTLTANSFGVARFQGVASAASKFLMTNAIEGGSLTLEPFGGINVGMVQRTKGSGTWSVNPGGVTKLDYGVTHSSALTSTNLFYSSAGVIIGASAMSNIADGILGMAKTTASSGAPGAVGGMLQMVCGTNAGSLKLIMFGGTSTTPVTVIDNVGSGATGC